jgi:ATP/maltotriose-dependent transcriptional regulator MalT
MQHTVKTQAIAVYRKLGVSSRNDAIDRASDLGLVDLGVLSSPPA